MKILVIGFQRSGTTLLRRLIDLHPNVLWILHETRLLSKEGLTNVNVISRYIKNNISNAESYKFATILKKNWGEKLPWYGNGSNIIYYANKWSNIFRDESKIIHIVRHPIDVALSNVEKRDLIQQLLLNIIQIIFLV